MEKVERDKAFNGFRNGSSRVLISSNVTARGIDIQQVSIVINFDVPKCVHTYLHRIGRSGRWGRKGVGINFITRRDVGQLKRIEEHYATQINEMPEDINDVITQYHSIYKDFLFLGAVPVDFDELPILGINNLNFDILKANGKTQIGLVINLDEHWKDGSHWVALYFNIIIRIMKISFLLI